MHVLAATFTIGSVLRPIGHWLLGEMPGMVMGLVLGIWLDKTTKV